MRGAKAGAGMSRERYWGVQDAESEGQAVVPSFRSLKGSGAAGGLNWGRGTWREAHSGEGSDAGLGSERNRGSSVLGFQSVTGHRERMGEIGWGEREGT